jgi:hypothetical protein
MMTLKLDFVANAVSDSAEAKPDHQTYRIRKPLHFRIAAAQSRRRSRSAR